MPAQSSKGKRLVESAEPLLESGEDPEQKEIYARRWRSCLKVTLVIFALYLVLKFFGWLFSPSSPEPPPPAPVPASSAPPKPQEWANPLCGIPVSNYGTTQHIIDQCQTTHEWESLAGIGRVDDGGCYFNKTTMAIDCSRKESCHGGQKSVHTWTTLHSNLTYDCGSKCEGTLRVNCCRTCDSVRKAEEKKEEFVHCLGCEEHALRDIVNKNQATCSVDEDGFFSCESKDRCLVKPHENSKAKITQSLSCSIIPCGVCTTPQLQAKCCSICLASLCGNPKERQVCTGCDRSE